MHHCHTRAQACLAIPPPKKKISARQPTIHTTQAVAVPAPHYSKGLSPPIFSHFFG